MADSIQQPFQRFTISNDDLQAATTGNNGSSEEAPIPVLQRSIEAKAQSLKLQQVAPVCVLVVGMAGSGKTTLMAALQRSLTAPKGDDEGSENNDADEGAQTSATQETSGNRNDSEGQSGPVGYCLNLDPATKLVPFGASIDIRDTVDYKVRLYGFIHFYV